MSREKFFRDASGDLISVKQAWRNPSMHIDRRYTPEEAQEVFKAVRTFMRKLAQDLPKKPVPLKKSVPAK
jgi:hypothetical protein